MILLVQEAEVFRDLIFTDVAKDLVRLFLAQRTKSKVTLYILSTRVPKFELCGFMNKHAGQNVKIKFQEL